MLNVPEVDFSKSLEYPFISGNGYKLICRWVLDHYYERKGYYDTGVDSNYFFVKTNYLDEFASNFLIDLENSKRYFNLITHNADRPIFGNDVHLRILNSPFLVKWYALNACYDHSKLQLLPIGVNNNKWFTDFGGTVEYLREKHANPHTKRTILLNASYSLKNNPEERKKCLRYTSIPLLPRKKQNEYFTDLANSYFTLSPSGVGIDCHRTWEALYCGSIPIITSNKYNECFSKNLPIIRINSWQDFKSEQYTIEKYHHLMDKWDPSSLEIHNFVKWW